MFIAVTGHAQNQDLITLSGVVYCEDSIMGAIPDVSVFNKSRSTGTISGPNGEFSIKMGKGDTIVFSTVQHLDTEFYFKEGEVFQNQKVSIPMKMDNIYMDIVSVMGKGSYEAFKQELLNLELPDNDPNLTLPIVNRYAEEYATGEASVKIHGPLTYLSNKIRRWKKRGINIKNE